MDGQTWNVKMTDGENRHLVDNETDIQTVRQLDRERKMHRMIYKQKIGKQYVDNC